ncbi:MAG: alpha/beta fold hydrolase [Actinobacteria bacterium]|nr:alpha/beta fold hydrolase [Actinomycetota bacterium]
MAAGESPSPPAVWPGAEGWSVEGGPVGVVVLHGFGGSPATVRPLAEALAGAGCSVELPRLPGHGTTVDDMVLTGFADWWAAAERAYLRLAARCPDVVVAGCSMGGTLAARLAARHPEVAGLVCINPMARPADPALTEMIGLMVDAGEVVSPAGPPDIADPDAEEPAYDTVPLAALLSLHRALDELQADLGRVACPVLVMTSAHDHVVDPADSDHLAGRVAGPVERVALHRSYHVATLDHDRGEVARRCVEFVRRVAPSPPITEEQ